MNPIMLLPNSQHDFQRIVTKQSYKEIPTFITISHYNFYHLVSGKCLMGMEKHLYLFYSLPLIYFNI